MAENRVKYTRKHSRYSSHTLVVDRIEGGGAGGKVLDIGSAEGLLAPDIKSKGFYITAIDQVEPTEVSEFVDRYIQADLERIEEKGFGGTYDYVILADILEHLRNAGGLLRRVRQTLRTDGGRVIVSVPNIAVWYYRIALLFGEFNYSEKGVLDRTHVHFYTKKTILNLLRSHGYAPVWTGFTNLPFEVLISNKAINNTGIVRLLDRIYRAFVFLWPTFFGYQIIIEATISNQENEEDEMVSKRISGS